MILGIMAHGQVLPLAKTMNLLRTEQGSWDLATLPDQCANEKVTRFQGFEKFDVKK